MRFQTFGDKNKKAVLLIHTLFTSADFFAPITQLLVSSFLPRSIEIAGEKWYTVCQYHFWRGRHGGVARGVV